MQASSPSSKWPVLYEGYLLFPLERVEKALTKIEVERHDLKNGWIAIPDAPRERFLLSSCAINTPPLMTGYEWPHGDISPKTWVDSEEQRNVSNFLVRNPRSFLLSDPRTGKTISTLWAIHWLLEYGLRGRTALVLAPKSTLTDVWAAEIERHFKGLLSFAVLSGTSEQKLRAYRANPEADIFITNYETLNTGVKIARNSSNKLVLQLTENRIGTELFANKNIQIVAIDEVTFYKNLNTHKGWIMKKFVMDRPYVWGITGTPTPNTPMDAYSLAKLVRANFIELKTDFQRKTMREVGEYQWVRLPGAEYHCARVLQPQIRYGYGDIFDEDKQRFFLAKCVLSAPQNLMIKEFTKKLVIEFKEDEKIVATQESVRRTKLFQMACGGVYVGEGEQRRVEWLRPAPRLDVLRSIFAKSDKCLVFIPFDFCAQIILPWAREHHLQFEHLTREMQGQKRAEAFSRFREDPAKKFLLAHPRLMAHGLNLSAASTIVWWGPYEGAETWQQANRRVVAPGARTKVYMIYGTNIERAAYERSRNKEDFQGLVLNLVKEAIYGIQDNSRTQTKES